eukprot:gnl/Spiro4/23652_TR11694_c0_g2_i1.p1 gnl/Spiro4/23652_TR11694_c0_g2~~gnl/Spiro4/23652_TR11694_c0_g2_i1.p1  ORF type:complete len:460 (+),score=150.07 gnl/Spiro4/23652_TR11694_c0_g2_i1:32-1381(+)
MAARLASWLVLLVGVHFACALDICASLPSPICGLVPGCNCDSAAKTCASYGKECWDSTSPPAGWLSCQNDCCSHTWYHDGVDRCGSAACLPMNHMCFDSSSDHVRGCLNNCCDKSYYNFGLTDVCGHLPPSWSSWLGHILSLFPAADIPFWRLLSPGTHDSGTYDLWNCISAAKDFSYTQDKNFQQQLELGVRYFDLRPCHPAGSTLRTCHAVCAGPDLRESVQTIANFLRAHPSEIVTVLFQSYGAESGDNEADHAAIAQIVAQSFGDMLYTPQHLQADGGWPSVRTMIRRNTRAVLVSDREATCRYSGHTVHRWVRSATTSWSAITGEWANVASVPALLDTLTTQPRVLSMTRAFAGPRTPLVNMGWYLTPYTSGSWSALHPREQAKQHTNPALPQFFEWIERNLNRTIGHINVIGVDYIEADSALLPYVVYHNTKILQEGWLPPAP